MSSTRRANQGGAVLTFIIIAVVLAVAAIGTAYFVRQRGEQARTDQAIAQTEKPSGSTAVTTESTDTTSDKPAAETPVVPESPAPSSSEPTTPMITPPVQAELPTTGPVADAFGLLAVGLLVGTSAAYAVSRRHLARSL